MSPETTPTQQNPAAVTSDLHAWDRGGAESAEALTAWVSERLTSHQTALAALLAVTGPRTLELAPPI